MEAKKPDEAVAHLSSILKDKPTDAAAHLLMANCRRDLKEWPAAIRHYKLALKNDRTLPVAANNLAYILAAHPDENVRDEKESLRFARYACDQSKHQHPLFLDTLAVCYAANGQFEEAIRTAQQAIELFPPDRSADPVLSSIRERLKKFQAKQAFRESW
jgi:tetratricopeptide (TPR) repeat protein